jgi:predicted dehydrogenase
VVGCGLVAQVMHLPYLRELDDRFEVRALCDLSEAALANAARLFPDASLLRDWEELIGEPLDVVFVLTGGSHEPVAVAAAERGLHVFVEKPMAFSVDEGLRMVEAAERAGVSLMVGYMKRYDPAYEHLAELLPQDVRLVRSTTLESPLEPYVAHYPLVRPDDIEPAVLAELAEDDARRVAAALGSDEEPVASAYRAILLDSMVHELNAVRGLLGEPAELRFADVWGAPDGLTATLAFDGVEAVFMWVDLPGIARYQGELSFFSADGRATIAFPSPFLRSMPSRLVLESGVPGTADGWRTEREVSYEEAFKRELVELHSAIAENRAPRTSGQDAVHDLALCQSIAAACLRGETVQSPSNPEIHASRSVH